MKTNYQCVKDSRKNRKEDILYVMGEKCCLCGYDKAKTTLELHHIEPEEKEFTIGKCLNRAWDILHSEIQKCVLVCANCHREIHEGLITEELISSYIPERGQEIDKKIYDFKRKKVHYCIDCGAEISSDTTRCTKCANLNARVVERPSRDELKTLIRTCSFVEIGRHYGVTDNTIRKWCLSCNLPSKKAEIKKISDADWLEI